jgi:hypothetical protein
VRGERPQPGPSESSIAGRVLGPVLMRLPANRPEAATVDHEVADGEELPAAGGLTAVHTPGRCPARATGPGAGSDGEARVGRRRSGRVASVETAVRKTTRADRR